jgi:hypothetical protein
MCAMMALVGVLIEKFSLSDPKRSFGSESGAKRRICARKRRGAKRRTTRSPLPFRPKLAQYLVNHLRSRSRWGNTAARSTRDRARAAPERVMLVAFSRVLSRRHAAHLFLLRPDPPARGCDQLTGRAQRNTARAARAGTGKAPRDVAAGDRKGFMIHRMKVTVKIIDPSKVNVTERYTSVFSSNT